MHSDFRVIVSAENSSVNGDPFSRSVSGLAQRQVLVNWEDQEQPVLPLSGVVRNFYREHLAQRTAAESNVR